MDFALIGNVRIQHNLLLMVQNNKLPHAVIIEGQTGLGKKTLAKSLAKAAMCTGEQKPCGVCKNCHLIEIGNHQDLTFFSPEKGTIKVDEMRDLRNNAYYAPLTAPYRVFIIDHADYMNEAAQNTLLKIIEEPPTYTKFIFLCENAAALLQTIRSRCVCFTLTGVEPQEGAEFVAKTAGCSVETARDALAAKLGNIGAALEFLSDENAKLLSAADVLKLAEKGSRFEILSALQPLAKQRENLKIFIKDLKNCVATEIKKKTMNEYSPLSYEKLNNIYDCCNKLEQTMLLNPSVSLILCILCDAMC